jgi:hypothetical protein
VLYLVAFGAALLVDTIPVFAPPAWTILAFIIVKWKPDPWGIIAAGATGSVIGRYILTLYMPHVSAKIFRPWENKNISFLLNLMGLLMGERRGPFQDRFGFEGGFRHVRASSAASKTLYSPLQTRFRNRAFPKYATSPDSHTIDSWPLRTHRSLRHAFAIRWPRFIGERSS